MEQHGLVDIVEAFQRRVNAQDWQAATAFLHPEFSLVEPSGLPYAGTWTGPDGFVKLMTRIRQTWSTWRDAPYPYEWVASADRVFKEVRFTATLASTGREITMDFVEVYEFRDGKIATVRPYYFDQALIAQANRHATA